MPFYRRLPLPAIDKTWIVLNCSAGHRKLRRGHIWHGLRYVSTTSLNSLANSAYFPKPDLTFFFSSNIRFKQTFIYPPDLQENVGNVILRTRWPSSFKQLRDLLLRSQDITVRLKFVLGFVKNQFEKGGPSEIVKQKLKNDCFTKWFWGLESWTANQRHYGYT